MYTGIRISDEQSMSDSCDFFLKKGVKNVVITLGERGVYWADKNVRELIPPFHVKAVDTVGAGDAFNGGLTAALAMGKSFRNAIVFASAVAALSVQKPGAAISIPCREETDAFLKEHGYSV